MLDLLIVGAGPAAMTAGLYAARAGLSVKIYEKATFGGALSNIDYISNFPGFDGPGQKLAETMHKQAENVGVQFEYGELQQIIENPLTAIIDGEEISAKTILIATGSEPIPLDIETSTPVSYCASCDGPLYKDKNIIVLGSGNSAVQESLSLSKTVKNLTLISKTELKAQQILVNQLKQASNVSIQTNATATTEILNQADGVFVFVGHRPATHFLPKKVLDKNGYIITDSRQMTTIPGLFAAGDARDNTVKQAVTASGDGASAAIFIEKYILGLPKT